MATGASCDTESTMATTTLPVCPLCDGMGMRVVVRPDGRPGAEPCECRQAQRIARLLDRARIPRRYQHCTLESYSLMPAMDPSLRQAHLMAQGFVDRYPHATDGKGLLFTGNIGVGKTHLAVGMVLALVREKSIPAMFCDYRELLKEIQHSYNAQSKTTELEILRPIFEAEVLVLDELGAAKPTEWAWDTVALILNTRYNDKRTTIITTNYADLAPGGSSSRAPREETLGDRIGERMRSRLSEMCVAIEMRGGDFRQGVGRARFD